MSFEFTGPPAGGEQLIARAYPASALDNIAAALQKPGSLLRREVPSEDARARLSQSLGIFAAERFTSSLADQPLENSRFVGGVCALSTRETTLLGQGQIEDPVDGSITTSRTGNLSDVITAVQVFETIGQTAEASAIVLEDSLWSDRVKRLQGVNIQDTSVEPTVADRNTGTVEALGRLRNYLFGDPKEMAVVRDTDIMEELTAETDRMLERLGIRPSDNTYRLVYAGMYSYVWREIMERQGVVAEDQIMVIYEPWKHFAPEDGAFDSITSFRGRLLEEAPFMESGSDNQQIGLIAYLEPRDPNGRIIRKSVPLSLLPNSYNYTQFDFSRFPIVPKKANGLPTIDEFRFADELDSMTLGKNPAFLWGLVYPPTPETQTIMGKMAALSAEYKSRVRVVTQEGSPEARRTAAGELKTGYSLEMAELSEALIAQTQNITNILFGGDTDENPTD